MIPDLLGRLEVPEQDSRPEDHSRGQSPLARRINAVMSALLFAGIEPDEITIDIDARAVIVRRAQEIHLRAL